MRILMARSTVIGFASRVRSGKAERYIRRLRRIGCGMALFAVQLIVGLRQCKATRRMLRRCQARLRLRKAATVQGVACNAARLRRQELLRVRLCMAVDAGALGRLCMRVVLDAPFRVLGMARCASLTCMHAFQRERGGVLKVRGLAERLLLSVACGTVRQLAFVWILVAAGARLRQSIKAMFALGEQLLVCMGMTLFAAQRGMCAHETKVQASVRVGL